MKTKKLIDPNFILIVIGQIISLFGNGILRFALPLYLFQVTGSSAIFGIVSAISFLPLIILMPIGGMIADRVNKRNIMVILDLVTGVLMLVFCLLLKQVAIIPLLIITLMMLYGISGLYQPTVQASMPVLLDASILVKGNSIISSISAMSNLLSPLIGGFLFSIYGIYPIIIVSIICFFVSAILELFIKIPHQKITEKSNLFQTAKSDMITSVNFILKEKPIIAKIALVICVLNAFVSSMIMITLPVFVTVNLNLSEDIYGTSLSVLALGGLFGGILSGILSNKLKPEKMYIGFLLLGVALIPLGISTLVFEIKMLSFTLILVSSFAVMSIATIVSIQIMTYVQSQTPQAIIGKVMALLITLSICSQPIGQAIYGFAFEYLIGFEGYIILVPIIASFMIGAYSKRIFKNNL